MKYLISFLFLALAFSMKSEAKVTLPSILGDNMVLQQQAEVKLWGKARPNATVTVKTSWNGQTYKFSSDGKGGWSLTVSTPVAGGPYKIIFNDGELLTLQNVLIGEVWFCSGQSNGDADGLFRPATGQRGERHYCQSQTIHAYPNVYYRFKGWEMGTPV